MNTKFAARFAEVWTWVGLILTVYGLIIMATGIYYLFVPPPPTVLGELNPCLWWGALLAVVGALFLIVPGLNARRAKPANGVAS